MVIEIEQELESKENKMEIIKTKTDEVEKKVEMDKKKTEKIEKKQQQTEKKMEKIIKKREKVVKDMEKVENVSKDDVVFSEPMILSTGESNLVYYPFRCVQGCKRL